MIIQLISEYKTLVTLILSGVIYGFVLLALQVRIQDESLLQVVLKHKRLVITFLIGLLVITPLIFSTILSDSFFSPIILGNYVRELLISILIVSFLALGWFSPQIFHRLQLSSINKKLKDFYEPDVGFENSSLILKKIEELANQSSAILNAWDNNEISENDVAFVQEIVSLAIWLVEKDDTGWYELEEKILYGNGLHASTKFLLKQMLEELQSQANLNGDSKTLARLGILLSFEMGIVNSRDSQISLEFANAFRFNLALFEGNGSKMKDAISQKNGNFGWMREMV